MSRTGYRAAFTIAAPRPARPWVCQIASAPLAHRSLKASNAKCDCHKLSILHPERTSAHVHWRRRTVNDQQIASNRWCCCLQSRSSSRMTRHCWLSASPPLYCAAILLCQSVAMNSTRSDTACLLETAQVILYGSCCSCTTAGWYQMGAVKRLFKLLLCGLDGSQL